MGYMTVISVLNDGFENIKRHPGQFLENIEKGMVSNGPTVKSYPVGNHGNPMEVHRSVHADTPQLLLAHCNSLTDINAVRENKDSLFHLKRHMSEIKLAKNLIESAEDSIYDVVGKKVLDMIPEGKDIANLSIEEIMPYCESSEWRQELNIPTNKLAKYIKRYYNYIKTV